MKNLLSLIMFFWCSIAYAQNKNYNLMRDGVVVKLKHNSGNENTVVKILVVTDNIFHIIVSPKEIFLKSKSLMVANNVQKKIKWKAYQRRDTLFLSTRSVDAKISLLTGAIAFSDKHGNNKLIELTGGREFVPLKLGQENTYTIKNVFESPMHEAFYGLGQHQSGVFNYKGSNVELMQRNTEVAVPFLISSKNYGLLWDNNSITHFGNPIGYEHINTLRLSDSKGASGSLTAKYFVLTDTSKQLFKEQPETQINYEFRDQKNNWPLNFPVKKGLVEWSGFIGSDIPGLHKFFLSCSGYTKVWLDGKLVVDVWKQIWLPGNYFFDLKMEKGKKYTIKIEWTGKDFGNGPYIALKYLKPISDQAQNNLTLSSDVGDEINYYFINGGNTDEVISGYRQLTGKAAIMPKWAMGLWQSRDHYQTQDELLDVVKEYRKKAIPLDNIVQDWQYWKSDQWGSHEFDPLRYPDPDKMIRDIHHYNAHFMISVWPKFYEKTIHYQQFAKKGWVYKPNIKLQTKDWIDQVYTFYDPFSSGARRLFWQQMDDKLFKKGVDAWWMDATEPELISNVSNAEKISRMDSTAIGNGARYINAYPLMNSRAVYEGQRRSDPNKRVFILTRSAFAGQQRFGAATWSGDIAARWTDLKNQVPAGLNFSLSGIPYWTFDIGGYEVEKRYIDSKGNDEEFRELFTRFFQFGTFCPLFRIHGKYPYREIYNIAPQGTEIYNTLVKYDKLRYRLMPYIYSLAGKTYLDDYTIMRALFMDFPADKNVYAISDQYMFGPALLVNPVYQYKATSRQVYLPSTSGWYDAYTGKYFNGGQSIVSDAPISKIPLFVKEGSIIPVGPDVQFAMQKTSLPTTIYVYTGQNGAFKWYEDEGVNYNYEKGAFSLIPFFYQESTKCLTIKQRIGKFKNIDGTKKLRIVWVSKNNATGLALDNLKGKLITYTGRQIKVTMPKNSLVN